MQTNSEHIVVYAPFARDSDSIVKLLGSNGLATSSVSSLEALVAQLDDKLGAVLMTEEALAQPSWSILLDAVRAQPDWSSYPFILLIGQRRSPGHVETVHRLLPPEVANVMILERPMSSAALLSAVRWAISGRQRQFATRDHLLELERITRQQRLMTRELAHRVKNTIAMLQSIVTQTMRPHPELDGLKDHIIERFSALARTHDLLFNTNFTSANFPELVERTLAVHGRQFRASGPALEVSPQAALSFALVLHELATNAIKYGAFSHDALDASVKLDWSIERAGPTNQFRFSWVERGGPRVAPPQRSGFGSRLIRTTLGALGEVETDYAPEGLEITFTADLAELTHSVVPANLPQLESD